MFGLCVNDKVIAKSRHWEDLVSFIEELKELNKKQCDRRNYKIITIGTGEIMHQWFRR